MLENNTVLKTVEIPKKKSILITVKENKEDKKEKILELEEGDCLLIPKSQLKPKKKISSDVLEKAYEEFQKTKCSVEQISKKYGFSKRTFYYYLNKK